LNDKYFSFYRIINDVIIREVKNDRYLKYLGKAGSTHFFSTPNNKRIVIVGQSDIPVLVLENYDINIKSKFDARISLPQ